MNLDIPVSTTAAISVKRAPNFIDLTGVKYGRLTVVREGPRLHGRVSWECHCACGGIAIANPDNLKAARIQSCGCLQRERCAESHTTHGAYKDGKESGTHVSWRCMMMRCYYRRNNRYRIYGDRGIKVCRRWHDFKNFLADMGPRPTGRSIERKNNDLDYDKDNCRWATMKEQQNNRRNTRIVTFRGTSLTISGWADQIGIRHKTLAKRFRSGMSVAKALTAKTDLRLKEMLES